MPINPKYDARFTQDPDTVELIHLEQRMQLMAKSGELFEPETLEGEEPADPASKKAQKLIARRDELIELVRPQCVDADGAIFAEEVARVAKEEFGLEDLEDWKKVNE